MQAVYVALFGNIFTIFIIYQIFFQTRDCYSYQNTRKLQGYAWHNMRFDR